MIKLSGYKPDVDIRIVYTGLRPGEKLYEEKFLSQLEALMDAAYANKESQIREKIAEIVSTYHPENGAA